MPQQLKEERRGQTTGLLDACGHIKLYFLNFEVGDGCAEKGRLLLSDWTGTAIGLPGRLV